MGIQGNYLYRVMPDLAERGQVYKDGRGWHARRDAAEDAVAADDPAAASVSNEVEPPSASKSGETSTAEETASVDNAVECT